MILQSKHKHLRLVVDNDPETTWLPGHPEYEAAGALRDAVHDYYDKMFDLWAAREPPTKREELS